MLASAVGFEFAKQPELTTLAKLAVLPSVANSRGIMRV